MGLKFGRYVAPLVTDGGRRDLPDVSCVPQKSFSTWPSSHNRQIVRIIGGNDSPTAHIYTLWFTNGHRFLITTAAHKSPISLTVKVPPVTHGSHRHLTSTKVMLPPM